MTRFILGVALCLLASCASHQNASPAVLAGSSAQSDDPPLRLGNFSVGLAVKDIAASRAFYEKLGFHVILGEQAKNWLILQNDSSTIGLFSGHAFTRNVLTFNPGWDRASATLPEFDDVREIQKALKARGLTITAPTDEASTGPASIIVTDPDGNPIIIDQHIPAPKK